MSSDQQLPQPVSRRTFLKRAAVIGAAAGGVAMLGTGGKIVWDDTTRRTMLEERNRRRPTGSTQWLTQPEYVLLAALASILVPSDNLGPGAPEAQVVDTVDRLVATSPTRQALYGRGLLAFDELALQTYGAPFVDLTRTQQEDLVGMVDATVQAAQAAGTSLATRVVRKLTSTVQELQGTEAAVVLFPALVNDVMQAFYTSEVAWQWLGYDGPPMPRGYAG